MGAEADLFNELLFGAGAWIGLLLVSALSVIVAERTRYGGIACIIIDLFFAIGYFDNVAVNNDLMWAGVIMLLLSVLVAYITIEGLR